MKKFSTANAALKYVAPRKWRFESQPFSGQSSKSFNDLLDEQRIKRALKRVVMRDVAPKKLVESIRSSIRG